MAIAAALWKLRRKKGEINGSDSNPSAPERYDDGERPSGRLQPQLSVVSTNFKKEMPM